MAGGDESRGHCALTPVPSWRHAPSRGRRLTATPVTQVQAKVSRLVHRLTCIEKLNVMNSRMGRSPV